MDGMLRITLLVMFVWASGGADERSDRPVVRTEYGRVRGRVSESLAGRRFNAFNGIPYAKPPLAHLRFKGAVSPAKYDGVLDASVDGDDCFQIDLDYNQYSEGGSFNRTGRYVGSEDCLYLNVYTPALKGDKLPVMVFIHGGAFKVGSGAFSLQGPKLFMDHDVVLVTINYRLGILGFLRADDTYLPGNLGLKDQAAALRWIKENIAHFNGDPDSITVFGESAGAASVNFQMLAPVNRGVITRGISQSGFVTNSWAVQPVDEAEQLARTLASVLGCPLQPQPMRACLQEKSVLELYQAHSTFDSESPYHMDWRPVVEREVAGALVTERSLRAGSDLPWIIGITSGEGIMHLQERMLVGDGDLSELNRRYQELVPEMTYLTSCPRHRQVAEKIKQFYLGDAAFTMDNAKQIVQLFSDAMFGHGLHEAGAKHRGKLYRYLYAHVGQRSFAQEFLHRDLGVNHGDELLLQFSTAATHLNEADAAVSKQLLRLWTDFARHGDPTPRGSAVSWPESSGSTEYLEMGTEAFTVRRDLYKERFQFWDRLTRSYKTSVKEEL